MPIYSPPQDEPQDKPTHSDFWNSAPSRGYRHCLALGWSPTAYEARATSADANERSWLLSLATDSSFAVAPPWITYNKGKNIYAANLFKRSGEEATPTAVPIFPPSLDSFRVAQNRTVWNDLLVPAAQVVDPFMLRPLAEFTADGDLIPPPSLQGLPLSPLVVGHTEYYGSTLPFWEPEDQNWSDKEGLKGEIQAGVLEAVKAIHDATTTEEGRKLKWERYYSYSPLIKTADLKLVSESQGQSSVIMTMEVEPFLTLADAAKMIAKARQEGTRFETNSASWLLEADAKLGKAIRNAEHEGASIACIHGGAGVLIILERVHITDEQYDWVIWPEIIAHMALADAGMGEAGPDSTACSSQGERTLPVDDENVTVLTKYGIVPIFVALTEYAKRAHLQHAFKPLSIHKKGNIIVNGTSQAASLAHSAAHDRGQHDKAVASPSFCDDFKCIDTFGSAAQASSPSQLSFVLAQTPFAPGNHAHSWVAYRSQDSLKFKEDDKSFIYKLALPRSSGKLGSESTYPVDVEVGVYERAKALQGRYIPELVAVIRDGEALMHSAQQNDTDEPVSAPNKNPVTAMVISNMGASLQTLERLTSYPKQYAERAYECLPAGYLANLARCLARKNFSCADAAAVYITLLVDEALRALHKCNVLHDRVFSSNVCLRVNEESELCVALINFEVSGLLAQYDWTAGEIPADSWSDQQKLFLRERSNARDRVIMGVDNLWPAMELVMARLSGDESMHSHLPLAELVQDGALD